MAKPGSYCILAAQKGRFMSPHRCLSPLLFTSPARDELNRGGGRMLERDGAIYAQQV